MRWLPTVQDGDEKDGVAYNASLNGGLSAMRKVYESGIYIQVDPLKHGFG